MGVGSQKNTSSLKSGRAGDLSSEMPPIMYDGKEINTIKDLI